MGMPDWASEIPSAPVHQEQPNQLVRPFTAQQLIEFGKELIEQFIKRVVLAVAGVFIPGEAAFEQLQQWGERVSAMFSNLAALFGITDADLDGDIDVNDVWSAVVTTFIQPLLDLLQGIKDGLNAILGPVFGGLDFNDLPTPAEVWQQVINTLLLPLNLLLGPNSPLNAANVFGRLGLPQFGSGVPIMALTTAVPNELEPFSATSVPSEDGWSFNASENAAQLVCDGSPKALYLKSGVIKVEEGQPLDTSIDVKYSGIVSGAGQTIRYVLETFTSADGSGTATPVVVGAVSNPSGPFGSSYSVTVDHANIDAGLTGFPVRVDLADMPAGFWATVADGGGDIRCHVAGVEVPREVVACDTATDTGELWVKVDLSPTVDTVIAVTVDGSSADYAATATYGRNAVWSNGFGLAMHTRDVADLSDVTGNGFDGVAAGGVTQDGDMLAFSGSGSSVTFPAGSVPTGAAARTVSAWVDTASTSDCCFWGMGQTGIGQLWEMARWNGELIYHGYGDGYDSSALDAALGTGLHHVALSYDGTVVEVFIDGVSRGTSTPGSALSTVADHNILGAGGFFAPFVGSVGEPRLSTVARSDAWVAAEFANRQAGFYGVSGDGSMSTPVTLGDSSWDVPPGVGSVRPVLVVDELVTAGTVFWLNTPELFKKLAAPLAGGLPAAIQDRIDDLQATWDAFKGGVGGTVDDIEDALNGAGQAIRDAIANAMGHAGTGHTTANILTYLQSIPQTVVSGLSDLATQSNQIRDILAGLVVTPINSVIQDVKDWWTSVGQKVQNLTSGGTLPPTSVTGVGGASNIGQAIEDTWNKFWDGVFRTTGSTGKTTADVQTAAESIADGVDSAQTSATSAQSSANSLSEIIAIPHIVPSWQGGLADDVSFPIVQIDGTLTSSLNKLYLIPVTTQQDRAYTALKFGLTGTSMTNFYVGIYYMDPTTGDIAKILDCGDVKSSLTSSYNQQMITLPSALSATRGDTYFIGLLQVGGTAGSLHRWSNATNFSTGLYPQFVGEEASGTFSSLPSSVTAGNIIAGTRIWAALGDVTPILAPGSAFYADGFNRANAAQLTTPWTSRYVSGAGNVGVYSNVFGPQAGAAPGANVYTYNSKMSTTNHEVQVDVQDMPQSTSVGGAILLRGNASGCVYAHLRYTGSSGNWIAEIRSISSYSLGSNFGSGTVRASGPSGTYEGSALRCTAVGNTYAIYRAGTQIAQWVDSGGIFTYDGTSREVGVGGYANSGGYKIFDNWQAKDI